MSIFSLLKSKKLASLWEFQTQGILWRLFPAPGGLLVGEDRDEATRSVTFFCIDQSTGIPRWNNVRFPEQWWIGIETVHRNIVFLHEFSRPDLPDHKKIIALDLDSGRTLWTNEELRFMFALDDCVYASKQKFEGSLVYELDGSTGTVIRDLGDQPDYLNVLRETAASKSLTEVEFPRRLTEEDSAELSLNDKTMKHIRPENLRGDIEFLQGKDLVVLGYHVQKGTAEPELDQHLKIVDVENGAVLYEDIIARKARAPAPDMFFARDDLLFYIKNRNTLKAVRLGEP